MIRVERSNPAELISVLTDGSEAEFEPRTVEEIQKAIATPADYLSERGATEQRRSLDSRSQLGESVKSTTDTCSLRHHAECPSASYLTTAPDESPWNRISFWLSGQEQSHAAHNRKEMQQVVDRQDNIWCFIRDGVKKIIQSNGISFDQPLSGNSDRDQATILFLSAVYEATAMLELGTLLSEELLPVLRTCLQLLVDDKKAIERDQETYSSSYWKRSVLSFSRRIGWDTEDMSDEENTPFCESSMAHSINEEEEGLSYAKRLCKQIDPLLELYRLIDTYFIADQDRDSLHAQMNKLERQQAELQKPVGSKKVGPRGRSRTFSAPGLSVESTVTSNASLDDLGKQHEELKKIVSRSSFAAPISD